MTRIRSISLLVAALFLVPLLHGAEEEKPLDPKDLLARMIAMNAEENKAAMNGNDNITTRLIEKNKKERDSWIGKKVKCQAEVTMVNGTTVFLSIPSTPVHRITALVKDKDDPLLLTLTKGTVVESVGVLSGTSPPPDKGSGSNGFIAIKDAVFTVKK